MFKALAWIHLLQLLTGTLSQENKVTSIEPYEGVQIYFTIDDSRTRVPLDLLIDGLQKYLVKICDTPSTERLDPLRIYPRHQIDFDIGFPGYSLMMWSKPGPRPTGVNFFEKVVIPYGALLFVRQWRGFGPVPSTTFKGSWYDSVTKRISLFHGSLGTDSQAVFHNGSLPLLPVTNATSAFNVSPYVFNGSMLMKSQDFNGSPLKAVPTDPWNYRESNFPDMTLTLKDFYWSSRSARDFVDRAIDARIRIFLEYAIRSPRSIKEELGLELVTPYEWLTLDREPAGAEGFPDGITFLEALFLTQGVLAFCLSFFKAGQASVPIANLEIYVKIPGRAGRGQQISYGLLRNQFPRNSVSWTA